MKKLLPLVAVTLLFTASLAVAQIGASTQPTNLNVTVSAEASLTMQTANTGLTSSGTNFSDYTGTTNFTYFVRTTKVGGGGSITVQITTDFGPAGGPSLASWPTAGDTLKYTCSVPAASSGTVTPCSGSQTAVLTPTPATNVASFGADTRSPKAGVASSVSWDLSNDPLYQTGSYTAVATFTISAT